MKTMLSIYVRFVMFLLPVMFLPGIIDPLGTGKNWLFMIGAILGMILWTVSLVADKNSTVKTNSFLPWFLLLVVWAWVGWFRLPSGVRMRTVADFGGIGTISAAFLWFWLWLQTGSKSERKAQLNFLTAGGLVTTLASIVIFLVPASKLPMNWPKDNPILIFNQQWSLTGNLLSEVILAAYLILEWGKRLLNKLKKEGDGYVVEAGVTSFLTLGFLLGVFRLFKTGFVTLDRLSSWIIAAEVFKRSPIWGAGIGDFSEAFSAFRPITYNLSSYWTSGFRSSAMGGLQLWTELGVVGVAIAAIMGMIFLKQKKDFRFFRNLALILAVVFLPINFVAVALIAWIMAGGVMESRERELVVKAGENGFNIAPWIMGAIVLVGSSFSGYWMYRLIAGEMVMRSSLVSAAKNDGGTTYNQQIKAIGQMPWIAEYRRVYSQTNLALANGLLSNKELSDEDKQKASVLIQQAVREAKAAISLEPNNSSYWINLASIYRQIVGVVDGAADWSFQAYQQAVALEPANPVTKLEMGGLLFAANRFDEADRVFEQVVATKSDFANGWYNWAHTAKKLNKLGDAVSRMEQAVALVSVDSGDYENASKELAAWKKELDELTKKGQNTQQKPPESLTQPQALPTASKEVNVPTGELAPPTPSVTQAPSPTTVPTVPTVVETSPTPTKQ